MPLGAEHGEGVSTDYMTLDIQTIRESPGRYVVFDKDLVLNPSLEFFQPESWFDQAEPHVERNIFSNYNRDIDTLDCVTWCSSR